MNPVVDSHCHIDLYPDPAKLVCEAARNAWHVVAVTNTPSVFEHTQSLAREHPTIHAALGLHPQLVNTRSGEQSEFRELLSQTRFVGEIGLDYQTTDGDERSLQRDVFSTIVQNCSQFRDRVLTIHSRRASRDVLAILGDSFEGTVILHYFSGSKSEVALATQRGYYFSVNPAMVRSKSGRELIACMQSDSVFTESDGPFVKVGKRAARPDDTGIVIDHLAGIWGCQVDEAANRVFQNFQRAVQVR